MKICYSALIAGALAISVNSGSAQAQQLVKQTKVPVVSNNNSANLHSGGYHSNLNGYPHDHHCASDALMDDYLNQTGLTQWYEQEQAQLNHAARTFQGSRTAYTIPVVFHVLYSNSSENVSDAVIQSLIDELNEDFQLMNADASNARSQFGFVPANVDIDFCLAMRDPQNQPLATPGINRVSTNVTYFDHNADPTAMKYTSSGGTEAWNRNNYLNVWICDITNGASFGTAGYAYKPGISSIGIPSDIDGIVIDYNIGTQANSNVLTHEVGHYLGLSHTWGNSNQAAGCSDDDGLSDTPNTDGPSSDSPGSCSGSQQNCGTTETQYENYMDYSYCTVMFTAEQANLMSSVMANSRNSLASSNACTPVNPQPPVADFSADVTTILQGGSVNFTDLSTNYPTSWSWSANPSGGVTYINGTSSTDQNVTMQFANLGTYEISLTSGNGQGSDTETKSAYINVVSSGGAGLACDTMRNYDPADDFYYVNGVTGYIPGHESNNNGNVIAWAEQYNASSPMEVRAVRFAPYRVNDDGGSITIKVYSHSTANGGEPGTAIAASNTVIDLADIDEGFWNTFQLNNPAPVSGNYWVGFELSYGAGSQDTFALYTTLDLTGNNNHTYLTDGIFWDPLGDVYTLAGNPAAAAYVMDVLTATGSAPVAVISAPTEACENVDVPMNGYGSSNASSFYWLLNDSGNTGPYYDGNANTNYQYYADTWTVELYAEGGCMTDMASTTLTIHPEITTNHTPTSENCTGQDGEINFSGTAGGVGAPYNYSINNGATTQTGTAFTGLSSGTYNVIVTDALGCEYVGVQNVARINSLTVAATANPGTNITSGQTVTLDATSSGATSYTWFEGNVTIGTTQQVNVSPTVTTTYIVSAEDANGCEATDEITITVTVGLDESEIGRYINVYPNPSSALINLSVGFEESKDLQVEILDLLGKVVQSTRINGVSKGLHQFDLTNEAEGFYLMRINDGTEVFTTRISIVK